MTKNTVKLLLVIQVIILLVGATILGVSLDSIVIEMNAPVMVSSWAHFLLFSGIAIVTRLSPLSWT